MIRLALKTWDRVIHRKLVIIIVLIGLALYYLTIYTQKIYASSNKANRKVIIFHAGSLSVPFKAIEKEFEDLYPDIDIQLEPSGSQRAARKITDLKRPCDIMASADYRIIDKFLIPEYTSWNILFASNQMVLCYTKNSRYAEEINSDNWYRILQKEDVVWGYADPDLDPCGYRSLMVMQLSEWYYQKPGLYKRLLNNSKKENIRPKSVELISLLQTGNMDYAWEYRSVAKQHDLDFIVLPDEINLSNYDYDTIYSKASVEITGKRPGFGLIIRGKSITYGITLLKNAPNKKDAITFLNFLLNPQEGLRILKKMGQPPIVPPKVLSVRMKKSLPDELKGFVDVIVKGKD